ncbi:unnamed protein product [Callosobruchus maculatus]|uniref:Uncharacterized protein n=1 Tax=Callosobruchus maculatus TaxID=64391 RepID=A0A653DVF7_CALMS|nr:unnamed protein product [Callosobruchus maculatus]
MSRRRHWKLSRGHFVAFSEIGERGPDECSRKNRSCGFRIFALPSKNPVRT